MLDMKSITRNKVNKLLQTIYIYIEWSYLSYINRVYDLNQTVVEERRKQYGIFNE